MSFDPNKIRLHIANDLQERVVVPLTREQAHYLGNVMRRKESESVWLFNGRNGEWRCELLAVGRKGGEALPVEQSASQVDTPPLTLFFAPVKRTPMEFLVQKAVELGVTHLQPVLTERTTNRRMKEERLVSIAIEAAEQSERLDVPVLLPTISFPELLQDLPVDHLLFCDEDDGMNAMADVLSGQDEGGSWGIIIGPEGGFSGAERHALQSDERVIGVGLGPRILRAETAAIAALTIFQSTLGDF
jgi:16S rRNA (uracil1498-N3)-methyltransferase